MSGGLLADRIRAHVSRTVVEPARRSAKTEVVIVANEVHASMGLKNRMPAVCAALDASRFQDEYNLVLASVALALAATGPGAWSLDNALSISMHGVLWAVGALVVGVVGGVGAVLSGRAYGRHAGRAVGHSPTAA